MKYFSLIDEKFFKFKTFDEVVPFIDTTVKCVYCIFYIQYNVNNAVSGHTHTSQFC